MAADPRNKLRLHDLKALKGKRRLAMVTAYDAPSARLAAGAGVDIILVGDSAAMVVLGHDSTLPVTLEEMAMLTAAAARGLHGSPLPDQGREPLLVADLPFGSYVSDEEALRSASALMKVGADAVKLEGAGPSVSRVSALVGSGIAVMGHLGLTPQSYTLLGGYRAQGKTAAEARRLVKDARQLEAAGVFAIVLEAMPPEVASLITAATSVPTIGIGAGREVDGQVLVWHDLLGISSGQLPRFVKRYAALGEETTRALERYVEEVHNGSFPANEHTYAMADEERTELESAQDLLSARQAQGSR